MVTSLAVSCTTLCVTALLRSMTFGSMRLRRGSISYLPRCLVHHARVTALLRSMTFGSKGVRGNLIGKSFGGGEADGIEGRTGHDDGLSVGSYRQQAIRQFGSPLVVEVAIRVVDNHTAFFLFLSPFIKDIKGIGERLRQLLWHIRHQATQPRGRAQRHGFALQRDISPFQRPQPQQSPHQQRLPAALYARQTSHLACRSHEREIVYQHPSARYDSSVFQFNHATINYPLGSAACVASRSKNYQLSTINYQLFTCIVIQCTDPCWRMMVRASMGTISRSGNACWTMRNASSSFSG